MQWTRIPTRPRAGQEAAQTKSASRAHGSLTESSRFAPSIGAVVSLTFWFAGPALVDLMTTSESVCQTARIFLPLAALFPVVGTLAYQMDGVFIGATWSVDMRNMMLLSLAAYAAAWWPLEHAFGIAGVWGALLVFLIVRGLSLVWRTFVRIGPTFHA